MNYRDLPLHIEVTGLEPYRLPAGTVWRLYGWLVRPSKVPDGELGLIRLKVAEHVVAEAPVRALLDAWTRFHQYDPTILDVIKRAESRFNDVLDALEAQGVMLAKAPESVLERQRFLRRTLGLVDVAKVIYAETLAAKGAALTPDAGFYSPVSIAGAWGLEFDRDDLKPLAVTLIGLQHQIRDRLG